MAEGAENRGSRGPNDNDQQLPSPFQSPAQSQRQALHDLHLSGAGGSGSPDPTDLTYQAVSTRAPTLVGQDSSRQSYRASAYGLEGFQRGSTYDGVGLTGGMSAVSPSDFRSGPTIEEEPESVLDVDNRSIGEPPVSGQRLSRVPVGSHSTSPSIPQQQGFAQPGFVPPPGFAPPPGPARPISSTEYQGAGAYVQTQAQQPGYERGYSNAAAYDLPSSYDAKRDGESTPANRYSRRETLHPGQHTSTERLNRSFLGAESVRSSMTRRSKYDNEFQPDICPTKSPFYHGRRNWLAISILILAIFSTVFSGIFMVIALRAPLWGRAIKTSGGLSASTANVLTQLFAKLIEMSFVTVFVAFLGQVLSRRAVSRDSRGVTLAEMSMRNWVMQPGSIFVHYESVQYAALTFLGALALTVAIMAMLYSTAASALISPDLRFGPYQDKLLFGEVMASFANPNYIASKCLTPIVPNSWDAAYSSQNVSTTCLTIEHASSAFHNFQEYMNIWAAVTNAGNGTQDQKKRPLAPGLFYQNTTVNGSWINVIDTKSVSTQLGRVVNNITMAMPHVGVFQAARDPLNNIMQPEDLNGQGLYNIKAALPSPYVNVICANIDEDDIAPFVYSQVKGVVLNATKDLPTNYVNHFNWTYLNTLQTPLDDVFGWTADQRPPVFYKFPIMYNTLLNNTANWGRDGIYLLGHGDVTDNYGAKYFMCKIKAGTTPVCSTRYNVQGQVGGLMSSHCEDPNDEYAYIKGNSSRETTVSLDWINVAETAFNALSLNNGVTDGDASNARILTQFMLQKGELHPNLPSPAEAIAVLAGSTLLMSSQGSPFVEFFNYSSPTLNSPQIQAFNSSLQAQQFASGGTIGYQKGFHIVLILVFFMNVFVLIYFIVNKGLVTDFSEPPNLFAISINSPPNPLMAGSCGGGPEGKQYSIKFGVELENEHLYMTDKSEGFYGASGRGAIREGVHSFRDLFGRVKGDRGTGRFQQIREEHGVEMGDVVSATSGISRDTSYKGQASGSATEVERDEVLSPAESKRRLHLSKTFSLLAKKKSNL